MSMFKQVEGRYDFDDFMTLPELLLRWPSDPHFKITYAVYNRQLHTYYVEEIFTSKDGTTELEISDATDGFTVCVSSFMHDSWRILFKREEILNIEAKNSDFTKKKEINKASYQMSCTRENVGQLAALTIYLICKFNSPKLGVEINDYLMRRATARKEETSECPSGAVESWSIESAKLWKLYNEMAKRKIAKKNEYDVDAIKVYAKSLLNEGVEFYEVVRKIYIKYINLKAAQLGQIFPYEEGVDVKYSGKQSRWKKLQKDLFVIYPELTNEKSVKKSLPKNYKS